MSVHLLFLAESLPQKRSRGLGAPNKLVHVLPYLLEAQQRYFSDRAIHVAIVSQNSFVLVFWGILREKLNRGVSKPGDFQTGGLPTFFGKVQSVSRTLSGLFLAGAVHRL